MQGHLTLCAGAHAATLQGRSMSDRSSLFENGHVACMHVNDEIMDLVVDA
jgi:hypothetical protein